MSTQIMRLLAAPLRMKCPIGAVVTIIWAVLAHNATAQVSSTSLAGTSPAGTSLAGELELVRLVDLCAERLGVPIEYDPRVFQQAKVTLRLASAVTDDELWNLTNQLLTARGLTSIQTRGGERAVLSIVKVTDAAGLARIEPGFPPTTLAGYASIHIKVEHRAAADLSKAVKPLTSKSGGVVTVLNDGLDGRAGDTQSALLVSDVAPRLQRIIETVRLLDVPHDPVRVVIIPVEYRSASQIASQVTAAVTGRNALTDDTLDGRLTPAPDQGGLILVAPEREMSVWRELVAEFDRPAPVATRTIVPRSFSLEDVADLLERTARDSTPRGSGDLWKIITDQLTGSLIVTATPSEFDQIDAVLTRLNDVPADARRTIRTIKIRNRAIGEVVELISGMIDAGVLEAGAYEARGTEARTSFQRSERADRTTDVAEPAPSPRQLGPPRAASSPDQSATDPSLTLTADEGTNTLIAIGDPRQVAQVEELVRQIDVRQPQVMVEALVVSLTDGDTLDLGIELERLEMAGSTLLSLSSLFGLGGAGVVGGMSTPTAMGSGFTGVVLNPGDFSVLIRALETLNEGRSLNVPKVLVNNNQQALLDAVLQQPFTNVNASNTVSTTSFGGFENAGTSITVTPQIAEGDHLILEYAVSLSTFVGESSDAAIPPPRQQNNLQSVVTIPDGYTVVVGGLEVEQEAEAVSQIPLLSDLPLVGELFKNRSISSSRSKFYVFIRSNIMRQPGFDDLKYLSDQLADETELDPAWPVVRARVIR